MSARAKMRIGFGLVLIAVVGFIGATQGRNEHRILDEDYTRPGRYEELLPVLAGHGYRIAAWGLDEETGLQRWATVEATVTVLDSAGQVVFEEAFNATASAETGGVRRAQNGAEYLHEAEEDGELTLRVDLVEGDHVDLEVFADMDVITNLLPGLCVLLLLLGAVLILKARAVVRAP
jgi:hypothetical protein